MTKQVKINKQNEDVSRPSALHTGMKSTEVLGPSWLGALARQTPVVKACTRAGSRLEKVPDYGVQVRHRPYTNHQRISSEGLRTLILNRDCKQTLVQNNTVSSVSLVKNKNNQKNKKQKHLPVDQWSGAAHTVTLAESLRTEVSRSVGEVSRSHSVK